MDLKQSLFWHWSSQIIFSCKLEDKLKSSVWKVGFNRRLFSIVTPSELIFYKLKRFQIWTETSQIQQTGIAVRKILLLPITPSLVILPDICVYVQSCKCSLCYHIVSKVTKFRFTRVTSFSDVKSVIATIILQHSPCLYNRLGDIGSIRDNYVGLLQS